MTNIPLDADALEKAAKASELGLMNVTEAVSAYLDALVESGRAREATVGIWHFDKREVWSVRTDTKENDGPVLIIRLDGEPK